MEGTTTAKSNMKESHPAHLLCPIDETRAEIRLLTLLPDQWDTPIRCKFTRLSLTDDNHVSYTTLSYVWGDESDTCTIVVDDLDFFITRNLFLALWRIRAHMAGQPVTLWADALCIDRANVRQRNNQVKLMGEIYSKCREVILWMGEIPAFKDLDGNVIAQGMTESDARLKCYEVTEGSDDLDSHECAEFLGSSSLCVPTTTSSSDLARHVAWFMRELSRGAHMSALPPFCWDIYEYSVYFNLFQQTFDFLCDNP
jgi:hypothetical protein